MLEACDCMVCLFFCHLTVSEKAFLLTCPPWDLCLDTFALRS